MNNQILLVGGRTQSRKGFLSVIRFGLKIKNHLSINTGVPLNIWAVKKYAGDKYHSYIVLSFSTRKSVVYCHDNKKLILNNELKIEEN